MTHPHTSPLLAGVVAVITGASSGIGRATARVFAELGAENVIVADVREEPREGGPPTVELVREAGGKARFVRVDVTKAMDLQKAAEAADGLTSWVNCAGIFARKNFLDITAEEFDQMMQINVSGTFLGCQAAAAAMLERGGSIVNLASTASYRGSLAHSHYHASKGAVQSLTYGLALELAPKQIRVNAVHPGAVETMMMTADDPQMDKMKASGFFPMGRPAQPTDIANVIAFLVSPLASYISGASLTVDGAIGSMG